MRGAASPAIGAWAIGMAIAVSAAAQGAQLRTEVYASGFDQPVAFVQDPTDPDVFFVVERPGRIRVVRNRIVEPAVFLDITREVSTAGEGGLLGLALAPDYASTRRFFINFTRPEPDNPPGRLRTVIARYRTSNNAFVADTASRFELRWGPAGTPFISQPFTNHNGGHLAFGPDGFLYIGLGDGGSGNDPLNSGQTPSTVLGKFLRIDVGVGDDHPTGYQIPASNPFIAAGPPGTLPEIWSFGWRNPWRYTFDDPALGGSGALLVGDVGQGSREEIDCEPRNAGGRNYGWRIREGAIATPGVPATSPAFQPLTDPVFDYTRSFGASVTGGVVYRGRALGADMRGRYVFADFVSGRVWSLPITISGASCAANAAGLVEHTAALGNNGPLGNISTFGVGADGELFIVSFSRGTIFRLAAAPPAPTSLRIIR